MHRIFIVEDNFELRRIIKEELLKYDYEVASTDDFKNIIKNIEAAEVDLVLLDINLPYYDGFYICRALRAKKDIPIIIISSRDSTMDQVMALELGADDYITKPFALELLHAKIKAIFRRLAKTGTDIASLEVNNSTNLCLDENNLILSYEKKSIELTKNEFKIVKVLLENRGRIVKREELLSELWEDYIFVDDNTLTVNVTRVKQKLKELGLHETIKTKRGVGYSLDMTKINHYKEGEDLE